MINGNACFAYFNKIWGIPPASQAGGVRLRVHLQPSVKQTAAE